MKKEYKDKTNNKYLKIFFHSFFILLLVAGFLIDPPIMANNYDKILFKLTNILLLSSLIIPILILTSKKIKLHLPMFKKRKWWSSLFGSFIIFLLLGFSGKLCDSYHTEFYQSNYEEYKEIEKVENLSNKSINEIEKVWNDLSENEEEKQLVPNETNHLKIHYLDVGQGDSTFIELPNSQIMLIDAGESKESSKITKYIQELGYQKIDYLIGTHPHTDHIGGLEHIIKEFEIGSIYMPKVITTTKTYEDLLTTISEKKLKVKSAKAGMEIINTDDLKIEILSPMEKEYKNINNYSIVLKITFHEQTFLFMGDAEKEIEEDLTIDEKITVLKVGHHGSDTSSDKNFIEKISPKYAIISVGENNKYNHPSKEVVNNLKKVNTQTYQTNQDGTIKITATGKELTIETKHNEVKPENSPPTDTNQSDKEQPETPNKNVMNDIKSNPKSDIILKKLTSPISKGKNATIEIQGKPNTNYHISVKYSTNTSTAKGLEDKVTDENGIVHWTWKVGTNTKPGTYNITISGDGITKQFAFVVE